MGWYGKALRFIVAPLVLLFLAPHALAGFLYTPPVTVLCRRAVMIVEGEYLGGGRVKVTEAYLGADHIGKDGIIVAPALDRCPRPEQNGIFATGRLVVFFHDAGLDEGLSEYRPGTKRPPAGTIEVIGADYVHEGGCAGVIWFDDNTCYGYAQVINPGPYGLVRGSSDGRIPATIQQLREKIATGLRLSNQWKDALARKSPAEAARAMAPFLHESGWPKGYDREFDGELRERMREFGADAVPVLIDALRDGMANGEDLNEPVLILYDLGPKARPAVQQAVPVLCELLQKPGKTSQYYICGALDSAADPRAIPFLRPMLSVADKQVAHEAAEALAAVGDVESFDAIARLLPAVATKDNSDEALKALKALYKLDPHRTLPLLPRFTNDPLLKDRWEWIEVRSWSATSAGPRALLDDAGDA